jgi:hypothetical protein
MLNADNFFKETVQRDFSASDVFMDIEAQAPGAETTMIFVLNITNNNDVIQ